MQLDFILGCDFTNPRPVLPEGIADYKGLGRLTWITKCVNESGMDVARDIYYNVKVDLAIDSNSMPLGNDRVAIPIAESLVEDEVPSEWMFSMRVWYIRRVFLNGTSLYNHNQRYIHNTVVQALNCQP